MATVRTIQDADALLLYKVGPVYCCSPTLPVVSVQLPPRLSHPPGSNVSQPGVFKFPGGIVRVVDLRQRFGVDESDRLNPGRIIVVEVEGGLAGFWVDEIMDVIHFPETGWGNVPALVPRTVFTRTLLFNGRIQLYADFDKLNQFKETGYLRQHIEALKSKAAKKESRESRLLASKDTIPASKSTLTKTSGPENDVEPPAGINADSSTSDAGGDKKHPNRLIGSRPAQSVENRPVEPASPTHKLSSRSDIQAADTAVFSRKSDISVKPDAKKSIPEISKPVSTSSASTFGGGQKSSRPTSPASPVGVQSPINRPTNQSVTRTRDPISMQDRSVVDRSVWWLLAMLLVVVSTGLFFIGDAFRNVDRLPVPPPETQPEQVMRSKHILDDAVASIESPRETTTGPGAVSNPEAETAPRDDHEGSLARLSGLEPEEVVSSPATDLQKSTSSSGEIEQDEDQAAVQQDPHYHASIGQDEEGIVIILNAPDTEFLSDKEPSLELDKEALEEFMEFAATSESAEELISDQTGGPEVSTKADAINRSTVDDANDQHAPESLKPLPDRRPGETTLHKRDGRQIGSTGKSTSKTVIHIVVKGDTLWHIARRYINNPFRYPELARLSKIKNPDLIYPGDRVKIIINQKQE